MTIYIMTYNIKLSKTILYLLPQPQVYLSDNSSKELSNCPMRNVMTGSNTAAAFYIQLDTPSLWSPHLRLEVLPVCMMLWSRQSGCWSWFHRSSKSPREAVSWSGVAAACSHRCASRECVCIIAGRLSSPSQHCFMMLYLQSSRTSNTNFSL